jgi:hypothetical protein
MIPTAPVSSLCSSRYWILPPSFQDGSPVCQVIPSWHQNKKHFQNNRKEAVGSELTNINNKQPKRGFQKYSKVTKFGLKNNRL